MEIRNRMNDVVKLRCNVCQVFLDMILIEGWQQQLYEKAKKVIEDGGYYKDKYIFAYSKMREIGVENYSVKHMDITLISEIVHSCKFIIPVPKKIVHSIEQLVEDRNLTNHANENEEDEELYLRALLALCSIRKFINIVDEFEKVDDEARLKFRNAYMPRVYELMELIDAERIDLVQWNKQIDQDIRCILSSDDMIRKWVQIYELYFKRYFKNNEKDMQRYNDFIIKASDAGIYYAHSEAASIFLKIGDYEEMERRLVEIYDKTERLLKRNVHDIISLINEYLARGNELTGGLKTLVAAIVEQGYSISLTEDNYYLWEKNK